MAAWTSNVGGRAIARELQGRVPRYLLPDPNRVWPDENETAPLLAVARWAAAKVVVDGYSFDDRMREALLRLTLSFGKIRNHAAPDQVARRVAKQHLQDLRRQELRVARRVVPVTLIDDQRFQDHDTREYGSSEILEILNGGKDYNLWWKSHAFERVFEALHKAIAELDARKQVIIRGFYGFDGDEVSLEQIAGILPGRPVSVHRAAHLKSEAVGELRHLLGELCLRRTDLSSLATSPNYFSLS